VTAIRTGKPIPASMASRVESSVVFRTAKELVESVIKGSSLVEKPSKSYVEISVKDIVDAAGGLNALKSKFKTSDDAYAYLMGPVLKQLSLKLLQKYREIGEPDPTKLGDFLDGKFQSLSSVIIADLKKDSGAQRIVKEYVAHGWKDEDQNRMTAYVRDYVKHHYPKFSGEIWPIVNILLGIKF